MGIQSNSKKTHSILFIILGLLIGGGLSTFAYSPKGKELYADIWVNVIWPLFLLVANIFLIVTTWKKTDRKRKVGIALLTISVAWLAISSVSFHWPYLPWGRSSAFGTVNEFMTDLKNEDYLSAFEKLSPVAQQNISPDDLNQPNSQPISWHLDNIDRDSKISGSAIFSDGVELPIEIRMRWLDHNWKIYGVQFGEWKKDANGNFEITTRIDFMVCCDSHGIVLDSFLSLIDGISGR